MKFFEIIIIAIGLAMDAFAVSVCKGLSMKKMSYRKAIIIAFYFGVFQAIMPIIGFFIGELFSNVVESIDHWIAFFLLLFVGGRMIKDSTDDEIEKRNDRVDFKTMIILAIATSIDALTIGITFSFFNTGIFISSLIIGSITFVLSVLGVVLGYKFGDLFQNKAEFVGGIILIILGLKILLEHLGIIAF